MTSDELLTELGPLLAQTIPDLKSLQTPEEGFFFAWRLLDDILKHLSEQYDRAEVIRLVLEKLREVVGKNILAYQATTLRDMGAARAEEMKKEIIAKLEAIETAEDVDLRPVKKQAGTIADLLQKNHGMGLIERVVKANAI